MLLTILMTGTGALGTLTTAGIDAAHPLAVDDETGNGFRAQVGLRMTSTGEIYTAVGNSQTSLVYSTLTGRWLTGSVNGSKYEGRIINNSEAGAAGTLSGPASSSWFSLSVNRTWQWEIDSDSTGSASLDCDYEIREILDTGNIIQVTSFAMTSEESVP